MSFNFDYPSKCTYLNTTFIMYIAILCVMVNEVNFTMTIMLFGDSEKG